MGEGPRDWSPPGYWEDRSAPSSPSTAKTTTGVFAPPRRRRGATTAILSLLFGGAAIVLTLLPVWSNQSVRLVWTTVGLTAIFFGVVHLSRWRRGLARGRVLAWMGIAAGSAASALLVWGVLWTEVPGLPAPPQVAFAGAFGSPGLTAPQIPPTPSASSVPMSAIGPDAVDDHTYEPRPGRVVPPAPNAVEVDPVYQLQTNLVATAYEICVGLNAYRDQYGAFPDSLTVEDDGRVSATDATLSAVVPAYVRISYVPNAPDGTAYLTVADTESGMAMSCVQSGEEGWITNS